MFSSSPKFRDVHLRHRSRVYRKALQIAQELGARSLVDIGCAFGQFVEMCNASGIEAIGVDFPIADLQQFHDQLPHSRGRFLYGDVSTDEILQQLAQYHFDLAVILDTLRHIEGFEKISSINAEAFLIKEASHTRRARNRKRIQPPVRLWSPAEVVDLFSNCKAERIYATRFLFHINRPGMLTLRAFNFLCPTYTILLRRNDILKQQAALHWA